jgi:hypothetical protein
VPSADADRSTPATPGARAAATPVCPTAGSARRRTAALGAFLAVFALIEVSARASADDPSPTSAASHLPQTVSERPTRVAVWILPGSDPDALESARALIGRLPTRHDYFELEWLAAADNAPNASAAAPATPLEQLSRERHDVLLVIGLGAATTDPPPPAARAAFERALDQGLALVAINGAAASFPDWPAYQKALGGPCLLAADEGLIGVRLVDAPHPSAEWLDNGWLVTAPVWMPAASVSFDAHVILDVDPAATDWSGMKTPAESVIPALAWARLHGHARVFATGIGGPDVWTDEGWERLLRGAVRWAAGQAIGAPPNIQDTPVCSVAGIIWESAPAPLVATSRPVAAAPVEGNPKWQPLPGGGWYVDLYPGNGDIPHKYERLFIHVRAWLADGTVVRDTFVTGEPVNFTFGMAAIDVGVEDAVRTLRPRGRRRVFLPPGRNEARTYTDLPVAPNAGFWVEIYRY